MFRRSTATEEPRFLKDLLQALRDSEDQLAEDAAMAAPSALPYEAPDRAGPAYAEAEVVATADPTDYTPALAQLDVSTLKAEILRLCDLSAEWKLALRQEREQSAHLVAVEAELAV